MTDNVSEQQPVNQNNPHVAEQLVEPENRLPAISKNELPERAAAGVVNAGWNKLTGVQRKAIPYVLANRDIMVQSHTGSGKTGAFILPVLDKIDVNLAACQALVLVPTRELAKQVADEATMLAADSGIRVVAVYGGVKYGPQLSAFKAGAHIVIGTPGRILDHLLRRSLTFDKLNTIIFDEADRMLSMGFYPDMRLVQDYLPRENLYSCMFSATFPARVQSLARQFLKDPSFLSLSRDQVHVAATQHLFYVVPGLEKDRVLVRLIELENPSSAIIFCNTKTRTNYVTVVLKRFGYDAAELSGDVAQNERERILARFRDGKLRFLVATDVAARGIDVSDLSHAIQYEVPSDSELYIHRAGRTGRAGATGTAITFVGDYSEQVQIKRIAKRYNIEFEQPPLPTDEDVATIVSERAIVFLEAKARARDKLQSERMQRFMPFIREAVEDEESMALLAMLLDDYYQKSHNAMSEPEPEKPRQHAPKQSNRNSGRRRNRRRNNNNHRSSK